MPPVGNFTPQPIFIIVSELWNVLIVDGVLGRQGTPEEDVLLILETVFSAEGADLRTEIILGYSHQRVPNPINDLNFLIYAMVAKVIYSLGVDIARDARA